MCINAKRNNIANNRINQGVTGVTKGKAGYLAEKKKRLGLQALAEFAVVALILIIGYVITKTRLNIFTVVAIVGCLPAARVLVEFIAMFPYRSIEGKVQREIDEKGALLTRAYDMVITDGEHIMPVSAVAISNHKVFGYAPNPKTDPELAAAYIKQILKNTGLEPSTVKVFAEYVPFLSRVEGLNSMMEISQSADQQLERRIRRKILNVSM